jgi:hypothetical protein
LVPIHQDRELGLKRLALRQEECLVVVGAQGKHGKALRVSGHHIQGVFANGAGAAEDRYVLFHRSMLDG